MASIAEAVKRLAAAGYRVATDGDKVVVSGSKPLTPAQQDWLRRNKAALMRHVSALAIPDVREMVELFDAEVVTFEFEEHSVVVPDTDTTPLCLP